MKLYIYGIHASKHVTSNLPAIDTNLQPDTQKRLGEHFHPIFLCAIMQRCAKDTYFVQGNSSQASILTITVNIQSGILSPGTEHPDFMPPEFGYAFYPIHPPLFIHNGSVNKFKIKVSARLYAHERICQIFKVVFYPARTGYSLYFGRWHDRFESTTAVIWLYLSI